MINAWIVVAKDKHIDDQYFVFIDRDEAVDEAHAIVEDWKSDCGVEDEDLDTDLYGSDMILNRTLEDAWSVQVWPQVIYEPGDENE